MSDEIYNGPTVLAPVRVARGDRIGRWLVGPLAVALLVIILVFYVLFTSRVVDGDSMAPNLLDGERMLITKDYETPTRGDVVVFDAIGETGEDEGLIKRIVAVPGDTVSVAGGVVTVNGSIEPNRNYIPDPNDPLVIDTVTVPEGHVFVMGDNRRVSLDSRRIGFVPLSSITGRARYIWAPAGRARVID